jgi:hypothetical protein
MRLKITLASLAVVLLASVANAGPVYLNLVLDPATTTGVGAGNDGTSARSGAGTWHLYAWDTGADSLGIASYSVTIDNITQILNRTPATVWSNDDGDWDAGFRQLRSANDTTPPVGPTNNPVTGGQPLPGSTPIGPIFGYGKESSDFVTKIPGATGGFSLQTSNSWGDYATDPLVPSQSGLLIAEGNYDAAGQLPTISAARIQLYGVPDGSQILEAEEFLNQSPPTGPTNNPPVVGDLDEGDVFRNATTGLGPLPANDPDPDPDVLTWSIVPGTFTGATEGNGGAGYAFSVDPVTGLFSWDAAHDDVSLGPYSVELRATDPGGLSDTGILRFNVVVPEPASIALLGIAMVGCLGLVRRRNG